MSNNKLDFEIRKISIEDASLVNEFFNNLSSDNKKKVLDDFVMFHQRTIDEEINFIKKQSNNGVICGVIKEGKIIALATLTYFNDIDMFKKFSEIGITVDDKFQNKGVGTSLLEYVKLVAKNDGKKRIDLNVIETNKKAINFYKKNGFKLESTKDVEGSELKVIFMTLSI